VTYKQLQKESAFLVDRPQIPDCFVRMLACTKPRLLRLIAVVTFLCLAGQGLAAELQHLGFAHEHPHSHADDHEAPVDIPSDQSSQNSEHVGHHHHLSDVVVSTAESSAFRAFASTSFCRSSDSIYEGPTFAVDYPPQLS
jgi:hypothetical protein